jgi:UDP-2,3-diacylglucosamine pyrophosphatase LpxH
MLKAKNAFVISDIHLGASTGLLTKIDYDPQTENLYDRPFAEEILDRLLNDLKEACKGQKVQQLILLGDIFDLSFASYGLTMHNGKWFFDKLVQSGLFEEFIYIPGNHDHHIWQQIIEEYYLMRDPATAPAICPFTLPHDCTIENIFLDRLLPNGKSFAVTYPNYEIEIGGKVFYMHHGHFLQKLYIAASNFLTHNIKDGCIDDLEKFNSPFLEFGWYHLGQSYNVGKQKLIDKLYFMYKSQNTEEIDRILKLFLRKINRWDTQRKPQSKNLLVRFSDYLTGLIGPYFLKRFLFKYTRSIGKSQHASSARHKRLNSSVGTAIMDYLRKYLLPEQPTFNDCNFIFGHTHEPENDYIYTEDKNFKCHVYNPGGWVLDRIDDNGELVLPSMAPIYINELGEAKLIPFTQNHQTYLEGLTKTDPDFLKIKQEQLFK